MYLVSKNITRALREFFVNQHWVSQGVPTLSAKAIKLPNCTLRIKISPNEGSSGSSSINLVDGESQKLIECQEFRWKAIKFFYEKWDRHLLFGKISVLIFLPEGKKPPVENYFDETNAGNLFQAILEKIYPWPRWSVAVGAVSRWQWNYTKAGCST